MRRAAALLRLAIRPLRRNEPAFAVLSAIVLGVLAGYGAIAFREAIRVVHLAAFGTDAYSLELLATLPWWRRLLLPAAGGLAVGLIVWRLAPEVRGSGVPEVMEAVARRGGAIRPRVVLAKAAAAALTIGTGGSAGREGPIVHIGSAVGSALGQGLGLEPRRLRTFVACGAAAGIAATFNAPIAGALFAMEVILGDLTVVHLAPIVISSVVATVISRHHLGDFPAFAAPPYELVSSRELLLYAALGAAAGLLGALFT
ncbi:MAG: chloride channel protein, partial [Nitrospirae bacterium]